MNQQELKEVFDRQADSYDQQWAKLAPIRDALHLLIGGVFAGLPQDAQVLCVGAGTGAEILFLGARFPNWRFTAVEPSGAMLAVCRRRVEASGFADRCAFHEGYLDSLRAPNAFDAATALLVSQFILDRTARPGFFSSIAERLVPGGPLVSSDLSADLTSEAGRDLMEIWFRVMAGGGVTPDGVERMRAAYERDVAVWPQDEVEAVIAAGGFGRPVQLFQSGLICGWYARRSGESPIKHAT